MGFSGNRYGYLPDTVIRFRRTNEVKKRTVWVRVIKAHHLKGPMEGQMQFTVTWARRLVVRPYMGCHYMALRIYGRAHRIDDGSWDHEVVTVHKNFELVGHIVICESLRVDLDDEMHEASWLAWEQAMAVPPPLIHPFNIFLGDGNDRVCIEKNVLHWSAVDLLSTTIWRIVVGAYATQALDTLDGTADTATAHYRKGRPAKLHSIDVELA